MKPGDDVGDEWIQEGRKEGRKEGGTKECKEGTMKRRTNGWEGKEPMSFNMTHLFTSFLQV